MVLCKIYIWSELFKSKLRHSYFYLKLVFTYINWCTQVENNPLLLWRYLLSMGYCIFNSVNSLSSGNLDKNHDCLWVGWSCIEVPLSEIWSEEPTSWPLLFTCLPILSTLGKQRNSPTEKVCIRHSLLKLVYIHVCYQQILNFKLLQHHFLTSPNVTWKLSRIHVLSCLFVC